MLQVLDWLNENANRSFPFLASASKALPETEPIEAPGNKLTELPENFLLDLQIITEADIAQNGVFLSRLKRTSSDLIVEFSTSSQLIASFNLPSPSTEQYPYYLRTSNGNLAVFGEGAATVYEAFDNSTDISLTIAIEPSTITQYSGAWLGVSSISTLPEKLSYSGLQLENSYKPALPLEDVFYYSRTFLDGDVQLLEGYNMRVNFSKDLIDLEAGGSFGLKMTCSSSFLPEYCLDCDELVSYINGVPPDSEGNFRLVEGSNIAITEGTSLAGFNDSFPEAANKHTLFVGLTFQATDLCAPVNITPSI